VTNILKADTSLVVVGDKYCGFAIGLDISRVTLSPEKYCKIMDIFCVEYLIHFHVYLLACCVPVSTMNYTLFQLKSQGNHRKSWKVITKSPHQSTKARAFLVAVIRSVFASFAGLRSCLIQRLQMPHLH
jgi:hypothetical protein